MLMDAWQRENYERNMMKTKKCPYCNQLYYTIDYSDTTVVYCPPIYKNGLTINPDKNTTTNHCTCINCGNKFSYKS